MALLYKEELVKKKRFNSAVNITDPLYNAAYKKLATSNLFDKDIDIDSDRSMRRLDEIEAGYKQIVVKVSASNQEKQERIVQLQSELAQATAMKKNHESLATNYCLLSQTLANKERECESYRKQIEELKLSKQLNWVYPNPCYVPTHFNFGPTATAFQFQPPQPPPHRSSKIGLANKKKRNSTATITPEYERTKSMTRTNSNMNIAPNKNKRMRINSDDNNKIDLPTIEAVVVTAEGEVNQKKRSIWIKIRNGIKHKKSNKKTKNF